MIKKINFDYVVHGTVPNVNVSSPPLCRASLIEFHSIVCETCEQPLQSILFIDCLLFLFTYYSVLDNDRFIRENLILLPGPQDRNYVYTCASCNDGSPSMVHKIKNRYLLLYSLFIFFKRYFSFFI